MVFLVFQQALSMLKGKVCRYIGTTIVDREASGVQLLQDLTLTFFVSLVFLGPSHLLARNNQGVQRKCEQSESSRRQVKVCNLMSHRVPSC